MDFKVSNPGSGDTFIIQDTLSGESVSYTASFGDTVADVINGLYSEILLELALDDGKPWSFYIHRSFSKR